MAIYSTPCKIGDTCYIKAQGTYAKVKKIEIDIVGTRITLWNKEDTWEFWDVQFGKNKEVYVVDGE